MGLASLGLLATPGPLPPGLEASAATGAVRTVANALTAVASIDPVYDGSPGGYDTTASATLSATVSQGAPPYQLEWDFGDGTRNSTKATVNHTFAASGDYLVRLTVQDHNGSRATSTVRAKPVLAVSGEWFTAIAAPTIGTAPLTVNFTAPVGGAGGPVNHVDWSFGDGGSSSSGAASHTYPQPGRYLAVATATFQDGQTNTFGIDILVGPVGPLTAKAGVTVVGHCGAGGISTSIATLTADLEAGASPFGYSWSFGDGNASSGLNPVDHAYAMWGTYTAIASVRDADGTVATASVSFPIAPVNCPVLVPIIANLTANATSGTAPLAVSFRVNVSSGNPPYAFAWDFDDGSTASTQNATHVFRSARAYTVTFTVKDSWNLNATAALRITALAPTNSTNPNPPGGGQPGNQPANGSAPIAPASLPLAVAAGVASVTGIVATLAALYIRRRGPRRHA